MQWLPLSLWVIGESDMLVWKDLN